jgi:hypothetical protein
MAMPLASVLKSWSLTRTGVVSQVAPAFLKRPTDSRFLVSMLMAGQPWRAKR